MTRAVELTGRRFGRWTVLSRAENDKQNRAQWLCKCDCGREVYVASRSLVSGASRGCIYCGAARKTR